jgi:hypothetical protein
MFFACLMLGRCGLVVPLVARVRVCVPVLAVGTGRMRHPLEKLDGVQGCWSRSAHGFLSAMRKGDCNAAGVWMELIANQGGTIIPDDTVPFGELNGVFMLGQRSSSIRWTGVGEILHSAQ